MKDSKLLFHISLFLTAAYIRLTKFAGRRCRNTILPARSPKLQYMLQPLFILIYENALLQISIQPISKLQDVKKDFEFMMYRGGRQDGCGNNSGC
jgi:hypothetical protein